MLVKKVAKARNSVYCNNIYKYWYTVMDLHNKLQICIVYFKA